MANVIDMPNIPAYVKENITFTDSLNTHYILDIISFPCKSTPINLVVVLGYLESQIFLTGKNFKHRARCYSCMHSAIITYCCCSQQQRLLRSLWRCQLLYHFELFGSHGAEIGLLSRVTLTLASRDTCVTKKFQKWLNSRPKFRHAEIQNPFMSRIPLACRCKISAHRSRVTEQFEMVQYYN